MARHLGWGVRNGRSGMPRVAFAPSAVRDLEHLRALLEPKSPAAARRTTAVWELGQHPGIGRPVEECPNAGSYWSISATAAT